MDFADVIKLRTLRRGIIPNYLSDLNIIMRVLITGRWEGQSHREMRRP